MRKKKLRVTEKISYKMHPVMLDVYNFYEILSIGDWKKFDSKRIYRIWTCNLMALVQHSSLLNFEVWSQCHYEFFAFQNFHPSLQLIHLIVFADLFTSVNITRMVEIVTIGNLLFLGIQLLLSCNVVSSKSFE